MGLSSSSESYYVTIFKIQRKNGMHICTCKYSLLTDNFISRNGKPLKDFIDKWDRLDYVFLLWILNLFASMCS